MNQLLNPKLYWTIALWLMLGFMLAGCCITIALSGPVVQVVGMVIGRCCFALYGLALTME
jgi:hypothetical protein